MSDENLGCSDHNCIIERPKGMGTNGGCQCEKELVRLGSRGRAIACRLREAREQAARIATLEAENNRLNAIIDNSPLDELHGCDGCGATTTDATESEDDSAIICRACTLEAENELLNRSLDRANEHHERLAARLDIRQNADGSTHDEIDRLRSTVRQAHGYLNAEWDEKIPERFKIKTVSDLLANQIAADQRAQAEGESK